MKRILVLCALFGNCGVRYPQQVSTESGQLFLNSTPVSVSKMTLLRIGGVLTNVHAPDDICVIEILHRHYGKCEMAYTIFFQSARYGKWHEIAYFPRSRGTLDPTIVRITKPLADSLVIFLAYGPEVQFTRSYRFSKGKWSPR